MENTQDSCFTTLRPVKVMEGTKMRTRYVSVIIPSKRETALQRCLSSLGKQIYPNNKFEIIIVTTYTISSEIRLPVPLRVIVNNKANQAEARNIAEKVAKGEILAFCDDDCALPQNWISNAVKYFSDNEVATVGGPSIPPLKGVSFREILTGLLMTSFLGAGAHRRAYTAGSETKPRLCKPVEIICANMFVDRRKFLEAGGFDGSVPQEEDRLNSKFLKMGYKLIYDPHCYNIHYQRSWGFGAIRNSFWLMAGQGSLTRKRRKPSSVLYLIPPLFALGLITSPIFLFISPLGSLYILAAIIYITALFVETIRLMYKNRKQLGGIRLFGVLIALPITLFVHHLTSGFGFLYGFLRKSPCKER